MPNLFHSFKPIVKKSFLSYFPNNDINFFCDCIFNVVHGQVKMDSSVTKKKLDRNRRLIERLYRRGIEIALKRPLLFSDEGLKLLVLIQPSISNHLKKRHELKQERERICINNSR